MSIPKEPRQLMINLMYLVLTALLALNVSNEILNAFRTLSSSIDMSNASIDQRNKEIYAAILENEKAPGQAEKVRPYREKADEVVKRSEEMVKYLDDWKKRIVMQFLVESIILTFVGGIIGIGAAILASYIISNVTGSPFVISPNSVLLAFVVSAGIGILFGWYPARRAANLQPIEALRYE